MKKPLDLLRAALTSSIWATLATHVLVSLTLSIQPTGQTLDWRFESFIFVMMFSSLLIPFTYACFLVGTVVVAFSGYDFLTARRWLNPLTATIVGAVSTALVVFVFTFDGSMLADWVYALPISAGGAVGGWTFCRALQKRLTMPPPAPPA